MMNVEDLRAALENMPDDLPVYLLGEFDCWKPVNGVSQRHSDDGSGCDCELDDDLTFVGLNSTLLRDPE